MKHRNRNKITEGPRMLLVLRRRFLLASMGALLAVLVLLCAAFNVTNYWKLERRLDATLQKISANDGKMPRPKTSSAPKPESKAAVLQWWPMKCASWRTRPRNQCGRCCRSLPSCSMASTMLPT